MVQKYDRGRKKSNEFGVKVVATDEVEGDEIETYGSESRQVVLSLLLLVDLLLQSEEQDGEIKANVATPSQRGASFSKG